MPSSLMIFIYWAWEKQGSIFVALWCESPSGKYAKLHTVV